MILVVCIILGTPSGIMSLPVTVVTIDLGDIFHFFLDGVGVSICCKGVMATTTFLAAPVPKTSLLVVLVLFTSLALVGERLLVLATRCVSEKNVNGLSPFKLNLLLFCRPVFFGIL